MEEDKIEKPNNSKDIQAEKIVEKPEKKSNIKNITRVVLIITSVFLIWYILSDRHTPYTDQAQIKGLITPVTARV